LRKDSWAIAPFDLQHKLIVGNIYVHLQSKLWDFERVFAKPIVEIATHNRFYFPDVAVVSTLNCCSSLINPALIIEVKSSLDRVNCWEKWQDYQFLASLQEYAIVSQDQLLVEVYRRNNLDQWRLEIYTAGDKLLLTSVGLNLTIEQIYEDVCF
jgi:Uma2 family endonuclease